MKDSLSVVWCYGMDPYLYYTFCLVNSKGTIVSLWSDSLGLTFLTKSKNSQSIKGLRGMPFCLVPLEFFK